MSYGKIEINRESGPFGLFRAINILVDGTAVKGIGCNSKVSIDVRAGQHEVQVQMDWLKTDALVINVPSGQTVRLTCGGNSEEQKTPTKKEEIKKTVK